MRIGFMVPALHALSVGMKDGEHFFEIDPSALDVNMRARVTALISCGGAPTVKHDKYKEPIDCYGYVEPKGADLESFIAAHEAKRDAEAARKAAEATEAEAQRLARLRRDADTAMGVAAALEAFKGLPDEETFDTSVLPNDVQAALLGSRPWRAERDRRDALRVEREARERAAAYEAKRSAVRALLEKFQGERLHVLLLVERYNAGTLPWQESHKACENMLFGDLCALDTSWIDCTSTRPDEEGPHTAEQWRQRKSLIERIEVLVMEGWTFRHEPLRLGTQELPGRWVQAKHATGLCYEIELAYSAEDLEALNHVNGHSRFSDLQP